MFDVMLKRFETPDEVRTFDKGKLELVRIGGLTIARATYEPGWKWSEHIGRPLQQASCEVEHVGIVISGCATAAMNDGRVFELRAGDVFHIPGGHDSWVVGDQPYVSVHLIGATEYAKPAAHGNPSARTVPRGTDRTGSVAGSSGRFSRSTRPEVSAVS